MSARKLEHEEGEQFLIRGLILGLVESAHRVLWRAVTDETESPCYAKVRCLHVDAGLSGHPFFDVVFRPSQVAEELQNLLNVESRVSQNC